MSDEAIIGGIQNGEEAAMVALMDTYTRLLWVVVSGVMGSQQGTQDVEECVSDVFLAFWREPEKYDPARGSLKTYLALQAKSRALDYLRRSKRRQTDVIPMEMLEQAAAETPQPEDAVIEAEEAKAVLAAVRLLPEPTQTILRLRYFFGLGPQDISLRLALPKKEVENRLYQGKKKLKTILLDQNMEVSI